MQKIIAVGALLLMTAPAFPVSAKNNSQGIKLKNAVITSVDSRSDTVIATKNGTEYTIDALSATVRRRYGAKAELSEMMEGDYIWVWGTQSGTSITARKIKDMSIQKWKGTFTGTIISLSSSLQPLTKSANKLTLAGADWLIMRTKHRGLQEVLVYDTTQIKYRKQTMSFSDLTVGSQIVAKGIWNRTHSIVYNTSWIKIRELAVVN